MSTKFELACPTPQANDDVIQLAHGGGGRMMHRLLEQLIVPQFSNEALNAAHDGAVTTVGNVRLAFTTDSYVVSPLFFPGGDIGSLAVNGTANDLAMCGARPIALSTAFILEEGLPVADLHRIIASIAATAQAIGVQIVTGDTKVVDRRKCDKLFVNSSGIGVVAAVQPIVPASVRPGDVILLSGDIGRHGIAVMASREGLELASGIESDCASLVGPALALIDEGVDVHCLRDLTRGGLATSLIEIAESSRLHLDISETRIPVMENVRGACEVLGLDPLYLANEGRFVAFVARCDAERALSLLGKFDVSRQSQAIGSVTESPASLVTLETVIGTRRILDMQNGEQLPRIC